MANQTLSSQQPARQLSRVLNEIKRQIEHTRHPLLLASVGIAIGLAPVALLIGVYRVRIDILTRDIFATTGSPVFTGFLSNIGLFGWAAAAAVWLLTALLLARTALRHPLLPFAVGSGLISATLLFDDAFMAHELLLPKYLGLPEALVMLGYVLMILAYLGLNLRHIRRSPYPLLLLALGMLGLSMVVDKLIPMSAIGLLIEDTLKFAGIVFWLSYAATTALQIFDTLLARAGGGELRA